ncbi:flagellar basal body rod protein FlgB [Geomonas sp. RF6]|uniref:flagellar basal body rod protein FlgB n=1 Tax=Geomonas sp. RF6 TaxID=2897342 RepID=UPI001E4449D6|nr:flagellar basal body rod protein FlgB [Geomonas sp. RF6]UFS72323.1 flagellar basal body rod protein FlgB [Geomonas sp. RF6]
MPINGIFGTTVDLLGKTLDLRVKQQEMISANLANGETPGYVPTTLSFEGQLKNALQKGADVVVTNPRHIPLKKGAHRLAEVSGIVLETPSKSPGPDGNAVEMETEMSHLAENQIMYNASIQLLNKKFETLKLAIKGN